MSETIPLTSTLSVDEDLIIEALEAQFIEIDDIVLELLSSETRELDIIKRPVELDTLSSNDFFASLGHDFRGQKIQSLVCKSET